MGIVRVKVGFVNKEGRLDPKDENIFFGILPVDQNLSLVERDLVNATGKPAVTAISIDTS